MAKNRHHRHIRECLPESTFHPVLKEQGYIPPPTAEPVLVRFAEALNACSGLRTGALPLLTEQDLAALLTPAPGPARAVALQALGLRLTPRTISRSLCQDVRQRIRTGAQGDVELFWAMLGEPVRMAVLDAIAHPEDPSHAPQWSPTLVANVMWASLSASAEGARVLLWAAQQSWWPGNVTDADALAQVRAVAQEVADATPDFVHRAFRAATQEPARPLPELEGPPPMGADTEEPVSSDTRTDTSPEAVDPHTLPLHEARSVLEDLRLAAADAVTSLGRDLDEGRRATPDLIQALTAYNTAFDHLAERLAVSAGPEVIRLRDLDDSLSAGSRRQEADAHIRALLRITELPHTPAEQITALHVLVEEAAHAPEGAALRTALTALSDLVELSATEQGRDPGRLFALQTAATAGLPTQLASLPMAMILQAAQPIPEERPEPETDQTLALGSAGDTEAESERNTEPSVTETAEPSTPTGRTKAVTLVEPAETEPAETGPAETDTPVTPAPHDLAPEHDETDQVVARLVNERRFALAATLTHASGRPDHRAAALRIAALADVLRSGTGPCAARLRDELIAIDPDHLTDDLPTLLLTVPALVRVALVTGEPTAGALLDNAAPYLEPHLSAIAGAVGQRVLKGLLAGNPLGTTLADVSQAEESLDRVRQEARTQLGAPRNLKFRRATKLAQTWFEERGLIGSLLTAAASDDRGRAAEISEEVVSLSRRENLNKAIDRADTELRGSSNRPLQGTARNNLVSLVEVALTAVSDWLDVVSALERADGHERVWAVGDLSRMRDTIRENAPRALEALNARASDRSLAGAAHTAAADTLRSVLALVEGGGDSSLSEPQPDHALTVELLKIPNATVDGVTGLVSTPAGTGLPEFVAAADSTWVEALEEQVRAERYPTAHHLLDLAEAGKLSSELEPLPATARADVEQAEQRSRDELDSTCEALLTTLNRARLQQEVSEEQDSELTTLLDVGSLMAVSDLAEVRARLVSAGELLPRYRQEAADRLSERLDVLVRTPAKTDVDEARIRALIEDGQLLTAEELIYFCEIGEPVPAPVGEHDLPDFFPRVPNGLPKGITAKLVETARAGGTVRGGTGLDFGGLSTDARDLVADALSTWMDMRDAPPKQRHQLSQRTLLVQALRLIGYDVAPSATFNELTRSKGLDRNFFEFSKVSWSGRSTVPQFGSKLHGRLRGMVCWGQPSAELLRSWVDQDTSGESLVVAYLGTMSAEVRRRFAVQAVHSSTPVVVVDDAALAYLAAYGARQLDAAMAVLLPFSAVQPYARKKRSLVPPEMFYGRDTELREVIEAEGTQVIFGGRGLGKSALLRSAKTLFEQEPERIALHIELSTVAIGQGAEGADAVWDVLLRELRDVGVVAQNTRRTRGNAYEQARSGVLSWLTADSRRRLLVMLDESDGFFVADAPKFVETNRLKDLGQLAGVEGRAKVVFAGLHSVQRFAKLSNNTFKHLAQRPTSIGHLKPRYAHDLVTRPMGALGFRFQAEELIHRILGYCSYQPFLLQMFCNRLVRHMHDKRRSGVGEEEPPYIITRDDVETVEADPELREDITETFRDTLHLDPRYNIIANVLAHHAYERGLDVRLKEMDLREECLSYWQRGFERLDSEAFRAYLNEMVGLGLLASNRDLRGWRLRSANALRMIGTNDAVMTALVDADSQSVPSEFIALMVRRPLGDGRSAPLTTSQIDDLLGDHTNQVRLVLGSPATGITGVAETVRAVRDDFGDRYELLEPQDRRRFEEALDQGRPGRRRVVLSDLGGTAPKAQTCLAGLEAALERTPLKRGVTRSVILVSDPTQAEFWEEVLRGTEQHPALGLVRLRRYDPLSLQVWARDTTRFTTAERQARLLEVTGGWPVLVERAGRLAQRRQDDGALERIEEELTDPNRAAEFVDEVGLTASPALAAAFDSIMQLVDGEGPYSELVGAVELAGSHPDPRTAVACLEALSVFDQDGDDNYRVDPLLARCWRHRRM